MQLLPKNPYPKGCFAHQQYDTHVLWYKNGTREYLVDKYSDLKKEAQNYCRHSCYTMANMDTEAKTINDVFTAKFGLSIPSYIEHLKEAESCPY